MAIEVNLPPRTTWETEVFWKELHDWRLQCKTLSSPEVLTTEETTGYPSGPIATELKLAELVGVSIAMGGCSYPGEQAASLHFKM